MTIRIINLDSGELREVDGDALREYGFPDGFRLFDTMTHDELWNWLKSLHLYID